MPHQRNTSQFIREAWTGAEDKQGREEGLRTEREVEWDWIKKGQTMRSITDMENMEKLVW